MLEVHYNICDAGVNKVFCNWQPFAGIAEIACLHNCCCWLRILSLDWPPRLTFETDWWRSWVLMCCVVGSRLYQY